MPRRSPHTRLTLLLVMLTVPAACNDPRNPMSAEAPHPSHFACALASYSGMLPCFRGGFESRLSRSMSSAEMRRGRLSRGSMTSST